jgi:hypothetical protein
MFGNKAKKAAADARVKEIQDARMRRCIAQRQRMRENNVEGWPTDGCNVSGCGMPCSR